LGSVFALKAVGIKPLDRNALTEAIGLL